MGMGYRRAEFVLNGFVRFVRDRHGDRPVALDQVVTQWVTRIEGRKAITVGNEFGVVRQLCLFRRRSDPYGFAPDHAVAPVKESVFVPYIFSREEVLALLDAATRHEGRNMWGAMLRALTLVLYCTGMRLGEATRLHLADVDLRMAVLTVQGALAHPGNPRRFSRRTTLLPAPAQGSPVGKPGRRSIDTLHPSRRISAHCACGLGCVAISAACARFEAATRAIGCQALRVETCLRRTSADRLGR